MLYLEELLDTVMAEEGQTLMGLEFLVETLDLPMSKIDSIFKKALSEYSERRPMKKTTVLNSYVVDANGDTGYIQMPEGTTSCRVARYGILPNQMPRYYMPKFGEQMVEFDPTTLTLRVWPPVMPLRVTYTQKYIPTKDVQITGSIAMPYASDSAFTTLPTMFGGKTLKLQQAVTVTDPNTGEESTEVVTMEPQYEEDREREDGTIVHEWHLSGTMGTGVYNVANRELELELDYEEASPILYSYYPKYSVVKELDIGHYVLTKMFACRLMSALAALRSQATQEKLHNIDLTTDDLYTRAAELKKEVREICRSTFSYGGLAPQ
jgi:hypothetical protein